MVAELQLMKLIFLQSQLLQYFPSCIQIQMIAVDLNKLDRVTTLITGPTPPSTTAVSKKKKG